MSTDMGWRQNKSEDKHGGTTAPHQNVNTLNIQCRRHMDKQSDSSTFNMSLNNLPRWESHYSWRLLSWAAALWWASGSFWDSQWCYGECHARFEMSTVAVVFFSVKKNKPAVLNILFVLLSTVVLWWPCRSLWNLQWCCGSRHFHFEFSNGAVVNVFSCCELQ